MSKMDIVPGKEIKNGEDWKKELQAIETRLTNGNSDPVADITLMMSYLESFKGQETEPNYLVFCNDGLPNVTRAIMKRKFTNNQSHLDVVRAFLREVAVFSAANIPREIEGTASLLPDILDPHQHFYQKHGFPKLNHTSQAETGPFNRFTPAHQAFLNTLEAAAVVRIKNSEGAFDYWEIKSLSETRTEVEVVSFSGPDPPTWLSLETEGHRIFPFEEGDNADPLASSLDPAVVVAVAVPVNDENVDPMAATAAMANPDDVAKDRIWRAVLSEGCVLDARDKSNVWFQACIMATKMVEESSVVTFTPTPPPPAPPLPLPLPSDGSENAANNFNGKEIVNKLEPVICTTTSLPSTPLKYNPNEVSLGDIDIDGIRSPLSERFDDSVAGAMSIASDQAVLEDASFLTIDDDKLNSSVLNVSDLSFSALGENVLTSDTNEIQYCAEMPVTVFKTMMRVAFIGCPERNDEWIEASSDRLAPLDSKSSGRRGDNPIREEVAFLASSKPAAVEAMTQDFAVLRPTCFFSPYYIEVVNAFGNAKGFDAISTYLRMGKGQPSGGKPVLNIGLDLIIAVGRTRLALSKSFLPRYIARFAHFADQMLRQMTTTELRSVVMDKVEAAILSLEGVMSSALLLGASVDATAHEKLWLDTAVLALDSPFLNKRLGGLKMLTDLIRRVAAGLECPGGLRTATFTSGGEETVSFRVMQIVRSVTINQILDKVHGAGNHALLALFKGERAHFSLMTRSADLVKAFAREGILPSEILNAIWDAGQVEGVGEALHLLSELVVELTPESLMSLLRSCVAAVEASAVTTQLVDVVSAIGLRARELINSSARTQSALSGAPAEATSPRVVIGTEAAYQMALVLHTEASRCLWAWSRDGSAVPDQIAVLSLSKLDNLIRPGPVLALFGTGNEHMFPWDRHWDRLAPLIQEAVTTLSQCKSIVPATKMIQMCVTSWPPKRETDALFAGATTADLRPRTRGQVAKHLEDSHSLLACVTSAIVELRRTFDATASDITAEAMQDTSGTRGSVLSSEVQGVLNEVLVGNSRVGYKDQLKCLLNFLHVFARSSDEIYLPRECYESVWNAVVKHAHTEVETDAVLTFLANSLVRGQASGGASSSSSKGDEKATESKGGGDDATGGAAPRRSVCTPATARWIFDNLLCDTRGFISSPFFSTTALENVGKYFKWLNVEAGLLLEPKDKSDNFSILQSPSKLIGLSVFTDIIFSCSSDKVASSAAKLLMVLPTRLSKELIREGELIILRRSILDQCLNKLENIKTQGGKLNRLLMLLDGLLEESSLDGGTLRFFPHGTSAGPDVTFKLNCSGKLKEYSGSMSVKTTDTLQILLNAIAARTNKSVETLKVFHSGKEISSTESKRKTIAQLKITSQSTVLVVERPQVSILVPTASGFVGPVLPGTARTTSTSTSTETQTTAEAITGTIAQFCGAAGGESKGADGASSAGELSAPGPVDAPGRQSSDTANATATAAAHQAPLDTLPAVVLSHSPSHFNLLFELLDGSHGLVCDETWTLIMRLPSSPAVLRKWVMLECENVSHLLFPFPADAMQDDDRTVSATSTVSRLLYDLQMIDQLLQPAKSSEEFEEMIREGRGLFAQNSCGLGDDPRVIDAVRDWPIKFLERGGFRALFDAYLLIRLKMEDFVRGEERLMEQPGTTPFLLLQASLLITKLVSAIQSRALHSLHPTSMLPILRAANVTTLASGFPSDSLLPTSPLPPTSTTTTDNASRYEAEVAEERGIVTGAWGWRLNFDDPSCRRHLERDMHAPELQRCSLQLLTVARRFVAHRAFAPDPSSASSSSKEEAVTTRQENFFSLLSNILVIWTSAFTWDPTILSQIRQTPHDDDQVCVTTLLRELLIGSDLPQAITDESIAKKLLALGEKIGNWGADAVLAVVHVAGQRLRGLSVQDPAEEGDAVLGESVVDNLSKEMFLAVLQLRPPLIAPTSEKATTSTRSYAPLFRFTSALLRGGVSSDVDVPSAPSAPSAPAATVTATAYGAKSKLSAAFLSDEYRIQVCLELVLELRTAFQKSWDDYLHGTPPAQTQHVAGSLGLLSSLTAGHEMVVEVLMAEHVDEFVIESCLGLVRPAVVESRRTASSLVQSVKAPPSLCTNSESRTMAYSLLKSLCAWRGDVTAKIARMISKVHADVSTPTSWSFKPDKESRSSTGYTGLRNMGSTCYMNSLLQALYMIPAVREGLLQCPVRPHSSEEDAKDDCLLQIQKLFVGLSLVEKKSFSPDEWVYAIKDEFGKPINVMIQQDAQEFLQDLCDRLETCLSRVDSALLSTSGEAQEEDGDKPQLKNLLRESFGGKLCNLMTNEGPQLGKRRSVGQDEEKESQPLSPTSTNGSSRAATSCVREHDEGFVCISVDVKGFKGLEDSLHKFVEGETISDFEWDEGLPRVTISKRQCISELSDSLIFHLKRFELNFDTFRREKVNDSFPFPTFLNMKSYTREYILNSLFPNGTAAAGISNIEIHPEAYYQYELGGVLVHTGTTDSGHYFSYIKEPPTDSFNAGAPSSTPHTRRWLEFNDSEVSEFSEKLLDAECFGGSTVMEAIGTTPGSNYTYSVANQKSAYMLVYHRVTPLHRKHKLQVPSGVAVSAHSTWMPPLVGASPSVVADAETAVAPAGNVGEVDLATRTIQVIKTENINHTLAMRVFCQPHAIFMEQLVDALCAHSDAAAETPDGTGNANHTIPDDILMDTTHYITRLLSRSAHLDIFKRLGEKLVTLVGGTTPAAAAGAAVAAAPESEHEPSQLASMSSMEDDLDADMAAALALSMQTPDTLVNSVVSEDSAPVDTTERDRASERHNLGSSQGFVSSHSLSSILLNSYLQTFDLDVTSLLFAPDTEIRMATARLIHKLLSSAIAKENDDVFFRDAPEVKVGTLSSVFGVDGASSAIKDALRPRAGGFDESKVVMVIDDEDDDLAKAIRLSQQEADRVEFATLPRVESDDKILAQARSLTYEHDANPQPRLVDGDYENLSFKFIIELTMTWRLQQIAENWRKSDAYLWLLKEISVLGLGPRWLLIKRELICELVDIFIGDQSVLNGMLYAQGSRKRAPSSYVSVGPLLKNGIQPVASRNIPDWTTLLETLAKLVTSCKVTDFVVNPSLPPNLPKLDSTGLDCIRNRVFLSTAFRQARYSSSAIAIMVHLSWSNVDFSLIVAEILAEALQITSYDSVAHVFEAIEAFLNIDDYAIMNRMTNVVTAAGGMLSFLQGRKDDASKQRELCVLMTSFIHLVSKLPNLANTLSAKKGEWGPWMLKFSFQYRTKCESDSTLATTLAVSVADASAATSPTAPAAAAAADATAGEQSAAPANASVVDGTSCTPSAPAPAPAPLGTYMVIYGETPEQRELTWLARSQNLFSSLQQLIGTMGGSVDELMPLDALAPGAAVDEEPVPDLIAINDSNMNVATDVWPAGMSDGMSDEDLAKWLAANN